MSQLCDTVNCLRFR